MKNFKKIILPLLVLLTFGSCNNLDLEDNPPFYRFSKSDYAYMPTVYENVGDIITFRNQYNEEFQIEVLHYKITKESSGGLSFTQPPTEFVYYEKLIIEIKITGILLDPKVIKIEVYSLFKGDPTTIGTWVFLPTKNNGFLTKTLTPPFNNLTELSASNINYDKVELFYNDIFFRVDDDTIINKVYYDLKHGFVGFDDVGKDIKYRIVKKTGNYGVLKKIGLKRYSTF